MKRFKIIAVIALVLMLVFVVGGCGKKDKDTKSAPAPSAPAASTVNLQDGQWEITTQTNMPGMPQNMKARPAITVCLTKKDFMPQHPQSDCKHDSKISGNAVTFNVTCPDAAITGTYVYAGTTFEGKSQTKMKMEGKDMVIDSTIKGKYLGPCPPGQTGPQMKK